MRKNSPFKSLAAAKAYIEMVWRRTERELADDPPKKRRRRRE